MVCATNASSNFSLEFIGVFDLFYRAKERERQCALFKGLHETVTALESGKSIIEAKNMAKEKLKTANFKVGQVQHKAAQRYFEELDLIRKEVDDDGDDSDQSSKEDDPVYPGDYFP